MEDNKKSVPASQPKPASAKAPGPMPEEAPEDDFSRAMSNLGAFWNSFGMPVTVVVLFVSIVFLGYRIFNVMGEQARTSAWSELATTTSPEGYRLVAQSYDVPAVKALASLRGADTLMRSLLDNEEGAVDLEGGVADAVGVAATLKDAEAMYEAVLAEKSLHEVYRINAEMGLATVAETRSDWERAAELYGALVEKTRKTYPRIAVAAEGRLGMMARLKSPIVVAPARVVESEGDPEPAGGATTQPASEAETETVAPQIDLSESE